jgi:hypothetical protein
VHKGSERPPLLLVERGGPLLHADAVAARGLEALDERRGSRRVFPEARRGADRDGVGGPGRGVGEARADLDDGVAGGEWKRNEKEMRKRRGSMKNEERRTKKEKKTLSPSSLTSPMPRTS